MTPIVLSRKPGGGGGNGSDTDLPFYVANEELGFENTATGDNSGPLDDLVNSMPTAGGTIVFPPGRYKFFSEMNHAGKRYRIVGMGRPLYNATTSGTAFVTGTNGMTVFNLDGAGTLNQTGPQYENIQFYDAAGASRFFYINDTNRVEWKDCFASGSSATDGSIWVQFNTNLDCAWHRFDECHIRGMQWGIKGACNGFTWVGGTVINCGDTSQAIGATTGAGIECRGAHHRIIGLKGDVCNPCLKLVGSYITVNNFHWESTSAAATRWQAIYIDDGSGAGTSGKHHMLSDIVMYSGGGANTYGITIAAACQNISILNVVRDNFASGTDIVDNGSQLVRYDRGNLNTAANAFRGWLHLGQPIVGTGGGSPESAATAPVGSLYLDYTNGVMYVKKTGTGNTGWKLVTQAA